MIDLECPTISILKEEIELIENIMNFSQAKVLLRTNICKENKDEIIALHKYIFEKFGNERIEINPNRTIKISSR